MLRTEDYEAIVADFLTRRVLEIMESSKTRHVREEVIFRTIDPWVKYSRKNYLKQCHQFYGTSSRLTRIKQVRRVLGALVRRGKLRVVHRFPMRDHRLIGRGKEELVFELGGVLDELAAL